MRRSTAAAGSAAFFLAAPGVVAGLVPWLITHWQTASYQPLLVRTLGVLLLLAGTAVVVNAFARFVTEGLGTPMPAAPPRHLVVGGLYRYVRNPMYVAVLSAILGQVLLFGSLPLLAYAACVLLAFVTFVRLHEEPHLRRQFGPEYEAYRREVPGWLPRLRPAPPRH